MKLSKDYLNYVNKEKISKIETINLLKNYDFSNKLTELKSIETKSKNIELISWTEIEDWITILSKEIKNKNYSCIYGVPRGGLIFAVLLSYKTGLPLVLAPCKNCLIVDDSISLGITVLPMYNRYDIAVMYYDEQSPVKPTYAYKKYSEAWKVFPWDEDTEKRA